MNIEKSIEEIKIQDLIEHIRFGTQLKYDIKDYIYSIETLLTAYEKEKEKNKELENDLKDMTKKYMEEESIKFWYNYIHKDKIRKMLQELEDRRNKQPVIGYWSKKVDWFSARLYSPTILNLIEKQQKEIESLKEDKEIIKRNYEDLVDENEKFLYDSAVYLMGKDDTNSKWKDKIKAKIEEWDKSIKWANADDRYYAIKILQSLLEKE